MQTGIAVWQAAADDNRFRSMSEVVSSTSLPAIGFHIGSNMMLNYKSVSGND
jgi:hypothetical protein